MNCRNKLTKEVAEIVEKLYKEHRDVMYSDAKYILKNSSLAEDAVENAMERIIKKFNSVPKDDFEITRAYLRTTVKRVAIDMCKEFDIEYIDELMSEENEMYSIYFHR